MSGAPGGKLYGVLDCAVDPALHAHAERLEPDDAACLFEGVAPTVKRVSPFLVELAPADPLSRAWRTTGWGRNWGVLLSSRADLKTVKLRLKRFTQARLPDGSGPVLFRFWDPRVLRAYLPRLAPPETAGWFTDVDRWIVETEGGAGSIRYTRRGDAVVAEAGPPPAR
jgi:hypothetical protein